MADTSKELDKKVKQMAIGDTLGNIIVTSKKLKGLSYKLDKLEEKVKKKFNKGGRVGLKKGSFPDYSGDGKTTMKDILMGRGVIPKPKNKKKMMTKKSKSPMDKTVRKS